MSRFKRKKDKQDLEWDFFSFPCAFTFALGAFTAVLLFAIPGIPPLLFVVSLFSVSFGSAHIMSRWFRNRTLGRRIEQAEEDERERRALAARAANAQAGEATRRRRRRRA